jgi:cation:H+ antiporter
MLPAIGLLLAGLVILLIGGDIFVKGAASLAKRFGLSPLVIGLTIVAFGTSAPELVINLFSAAQGASDIAFGNVIGSNISNVLLVLGIAALIRPLAVKKTTAWKEIPFSILTVGILFLLANDVMFGNNTQNILTRADGLVLMSYFLIFIYYTYGLTKIKGEDGDVEQYKPWTSSVFILGGIICLTLGGKLMVDNAVILAKIAGLSELLIGLTITAIGTSLPELVTSAIAAYRGHVDIAIGNVVGSNIFNILWVLGLTPVVSPMVVGSQINTDIIIAGATALLLFLFMFIGGKKTQYVLQRWQGAFFILLFISYTTFIIFRG